jgi:hypothetical protein
MQNAGVDLGTGASGRRNNAHPDSTNHGENFMRTKVENDGRRPQRAKTMKRKIIQIAVSSEGEESSSKLVALCDDGTLWGSYLSGNSSEPFLKKWSRLEMIP